jgi:UDPglucose--hexose-1-phosphate uridylyltransferase
MTPGDLYTDRNPLGTWEVRVVPHKFPSLSSEGEVALQESGLLQTTPGIGVHEIIIESPTHRLQLPDMSVEHLVRVLTACQCRLESLRQDPRFRYLLLFRNYGALAGASVSHPHSQLMALPITPQAVQEKLDAARAYYARRERCVFCDLIEQEMSHGERMIAGNEHFVALSPFASRFPFEVAIYPRRHSHDFVAMTPEEGRGWAEMMVDVLARVRKALDNAPYNLVLQDGPLPGPTPDGGPEAGTMASCYHWHLELAPRLTTAGGFEQGTGLFINPVSPEEATGTLREAGGLLTWSASP